jgi:hypothetical protein
MSIEQIMEFLILPAIGWLLLSQKKQGERLTRIETALEILVRKYPKTDNQD